MSVPYSENQYEPMLFWTPLTFNAKHQFVCKKSVCKDTWLYFILGKSILLRFEYSSVPKPSELLI